MLGVCWKDVDHRVDLDLSIMSLGGKTGWGAVYRNDDFLFSGDVTAAPNGATEAHLVRKGIRDGVYLLNLNYYNAWDGSAAPFTLFMTDENEFNKMNNKSLVERDNMLFWADSEIDRNNKQKTIGVLRVIDGVKTFHAFEATSGMRQTATNSESSANAIDYYEKFLDALMPMEELLKWSGAEVVGSPDEADYDLSLKSLTKNDLIGLLHD